MRMQDDKKVVAIIGGGPAGSFAALHLLEEIHLRKLPWEVLIFEPRDYTRPGPGGCNRCAGVLSSRVLLALQSLNISLPETVIQAELTSYAAHIDGDVIRIEQPDTARKIVSVYRGAGPRMLHGTPPSSFDGFLLQQACERGARHIPHRVRSVKREDGMVVYTGRERFPANLVVLATGVNSRHPMDKAFSYQPPHTETMAQDEFLRPKSWPSDQVEVYFRYPPGLYFGAMIPKGMYLNISLLGENLAVDSIPAFLEAQGLGGRLSAPKSLCGCNPRIAVRSARTIFGDNWVAVGDAAVTRLYKDGIGSAYFSARSAMHSAVRNGFHRAGWQRGYLPHCRGVAFDNLFGRLLFRAWGVVLQRPALLDRWKKALRREEHLPLDERVHQRIMWGMFSGDECYRDLFRLFVSRSSLLGLVFGLAEDATREAA